jgi:hypothetical protein
MELQGGSQLAMMDVKMTLHDLPLIALETLDHL